MDGYYMLTMAWYLAESGKLAYNHGELTTGTQPLATLIYVALAEVIRVLIDWPYMIETRLPAEYMVRQWRPCDHVVLAPDNVCSERAVNDALL